MENKDLKVNVRGVVFLWLIGAAVVGLLEAGIIGTFAREEISTAMRFLQFVGFGIAIYAFVFFVGAAAFWAVTTSFKRIRFLAPRLKLGRNTYMVIFLFIIAFVYCFALAQHLFPSGEKIIYVLGLGGGFLFSLPAGFYLSRFDDAKKSLLLYIVLCAVITFFLRVVEILNGLLSGKFWQLTNIIINIGFAVLCVIIGFVAYFMLCFLLLRRNSEHTTSWRFKAKHTLITLVIVILAGGIGLVFLSLSAKGKEGSNINSNAGGSTPNILFITCDAMRPDHLGCYGYSRDTSPNIDKLADDGVIFLQTITQCVSTKASLASMLSGLKVATHGVRNHYDRMPDGIYTLAEILQDNGYTTSCFAGTPWLARGFNYDQGFDYYQDFDSLSLPVTKLCLVKYLRGFNLLDFAIPKKTKVRAIDIYKDFSQWRDKKFRQPFFIYIHFEEPHPPYNPPPPYDTKFISGKIFNKDIFRIVNESIFAKKFIKRLKGENQERKKKMIADLIGRYDGMINYVDSYIGRIVNDLQRLNAYDNTLVIISADHGQELLEHGGLLHGEILYDQSARIPLIMHYPIALPQGVSVEQQIRSIDIAPTILELCNISRPETQKQFDMDGVSLLPLIAGSEEAKKEFAQLPAFTESTLSGTMASIRFKGLKYIFYPKGKGGKGKIAYEELYNLTDDPGELHNLINNHPGLDEKQIATLKETLKQYMEKRPKYFDEHKADVSKNAIDRLKGYGYLK